MHKKVYIVTFGCQMNEADSEYIAFSFKKLDMEVTEDLKKADVAVINTCAVRQRAEDKAMSQIGRLRNWKREDPKRKLFVVGCAAEKLGEKPIKSKFPFVDKVVGAKDIDKFSGMLRAWFKNENPAYNTPVNIFNSPFTAYTTIMRGCSLKCSYCVVPSVRGEAYYLRPDDILNDVKWKTANGAKEIILLGQTVNSYRHAEKGRKTTFTGLLEKISGIEAVKRIRFMSPHPLYFDDEFFKILKNDPKIARHIHLPVQSGSDRILKLMRRGYDRKTFLGIIRRIREAVPCIAVSTDFIVGFPTETPEDFNETLSLAEEGGFSSAFCFKYSPRTDAREAAETSTAAETENRLRRLLETVKRNSRRSFERRIGRIEEVLLETGNSGRTSGNFHCAIDGKFRPGELIKAEITGVDKNVLKGKAVI